MCEQLSAPLTESGEEIRLSFRSPVDGIIDVEHRTQQFRVSPSLMYTTPRRKSFSFMIYVDRVYDKMSDEWRTKSRVLTKCRTKMRRFQRFWQNVNLQENSIFVSGCAKALLWELVSGGVRFTQGTGFFPPSVRFILPDLTVKNHGYMLTARPIE